MLKVDLLHDVENVASVDHSGSIQNLELHLWSWSLKTEKTTDAFLNVLAADEIARAQKLVIEDKRHQSILSRYFLRSVLASYLDCSPDMVAFRYSAFGKPCLAAGDSAQLSFNLSHSDDLVVLAISLAGEIGIDVEKADRNFDWQGVAPRFMTAEENRSLFFTSPARRQRQFYRIWTTKEACLKCAGTGLGSCAPAPAWQRQIYIAPGYVCSIASDFKPSGIVRYRLKYL